MSASWILVDADLSKYGKRLVGGQRLYFLKAGRKNVSIYELAIRKNVSIRLSAIPKFYFDLKENYPRIHNFPKITFQRIKKDFMAYTQKTKQEKEILDTLKKIIKEKS
jgi:hypothetical protein